MEPIKSETTINEAEKAVQAHQDGSESSDKQEHSIPRDSCKYKKRSFLFYLNLFLVHQKTL